MSTLLFFESALVSIKYPGSSILGAAIRQPAGQPRPAHQFTFPEHGGKRRWAGHVAMAVPNSGRLAFLSTRDGGPPQLM